MTYKRLRILISGQVQGVGFRPYIYNLAQQMKLTGWVKNNGSGVLIEAQGAFISLFIDRIKANLPVLAKIENINSSMITPVKEENTFYILKSDSGSVKTTIPPDVGICCACLDELFNSHSRYYLYPFLNCTHCGPRISISSQLPYDRHYTSMKKYLLCEQCQQDYTDSINRRYHAQPMACAQCGPQLSLPIQQIAEHILHGEIIALKGLGGYQLICDATNKNAVLTLRQRKNRVAKPFALMVLNTLSARDLVILNAAEEKILQSKERPIVLLAKKDQSFSEDIAPGLADYGIMLPSTPLHYVLFHALAGFPQGHAWLNECYKTVLIVTSANVSGEPLINDDEVAQKALNKVADRIIFYERDIYCRVDDSVVRMIEQAPIFIRRARGFVPTAIKLPQIMPSTLALGGQLKNTFCITTEDKAYVSQHIGHLSNKNTIDFLHESIEYFIKFFDINIKRIAHDLHPDFYTTKLAQTYNVPIYPVQHHHAHLASVAVEYHLTQPVLGLALDGYGYGSDGEAWGGELLLLEHLSFKRLGSFYPLLQPGGEVAIREPWRMAAGVMYLLGRQDDIVKQFCHYTDVHILLQMLEKQLNTPFTSSCGRLFDAASSILGINHLSQYEGQAAMQLESLVSHPKVLANGWNIEGELFNMLPTLMHLFGMDPVSGANLFHGTLIAGLVEWVSLAAQKNALQIVLLSGGCLLNKVLAEGLIKELRQCGLTPLISHQVPPNDGGLSLGQAWIAGRM